MRVWCAHVRECECVSCKCLRVWVCTCEGVRVCTCEGVGVHM